MRCKECRKFIRHSSNCTKLERKINRVFLLTFGYIPKIGTIK